MYFKINNFKFFYQTKFIKYSKNSQAVLFQCVEIIGLQKVLCLKSEWKLGACCEMFSSSIKIIIDLLGRWVDNK